MSLSKAEAVAIARDNGCRYPVTAYDAAGEATCPMWVICAFLEQETSGGQNIFGHDVDKAGVPRPFWGAGVVTESLYAAYVIERDLDLREPARWGHLGARCQGVGPMQLTSRSLQERADDAGGCWRYGVNIRTGAAILHEYRLRSASWRDAAALWNGTAYADRIMEKFTKWRHLLPYAMVGR